MSTHLPAWKRLGLKLKYAKDVPVTNGQAQSHAKGRDNEADDAERPTKRPRLAEAHHEASKTLLAASTESRQTSPHTSDGAVNSSERKPQSKRSVTFTRDTKIEDGDSRITIDFPAGSSAAMPSRTIAKHTKDKSGSIGYGEHERSNLSDTGEKQRKPKPNKKPGKKGKSTSAQPQSSTKNTLALDYIDQHWNAQDDWKFNKNRDVWIMANALHKDKIPDSHAYALAGYVRGLPSASGARRRLIEQCEADLTQAEGDVADIADDRKMFLEALNTKSQNSDLNTILGRYSRSQVLLWALNVDTLQSQKVGMTKAITTSNKKKKSRTDISDISSSDSDSDSDSESSSEDDNGQSDGGNHLAGSWAKNSTRTKTTKDEDTSSSESSSKDDSDSNSSSGSDN